MDYCWFSIKETQDSQNLNNETFYRPPVNSAQWTMPWTEKCPDNSIKFKYDDDDDYSRGYGQIE